MKDLIRSCSAANSYNKKTNKIRKKKQEMDEFYFEKKKTRVPKLKLFGEFYEVLIMKKIHYLKRRTSSKHPQRCNNKTQTR